MIVVRWGMLLVATLMILAAFGATDPDLQPSALRLMVTAVVAFLAPLFWPGIAATPARTALRIAGWSVAAACLAALTLGAIGGARQPLGRILGACVMLSLILLVTHAAAALLEARWCSSSADAQDAREMAGRTAALTLALLGSLPVSLGPAGELLSARQEWGIDAILFMSPLVHLAVASGNDLLRNQWFYQHSNLASLQYSYPGLVVLAWSYMLVLLLLGLLAMTFRRPRSPVTGVARTD